MFIKSRPMRSFGLRLWGISASSVKVLRQPQTNTILTLFSHARVRKKAISAVWQHVKSSSLKVFRFIQLLFANQLPPCARKKYREFFAFLTLKISIFFSVFFFTQTSERACVSRSRKNAMY